MLRPVKAKTLIPLVVTNCDLKQPEVETIISFYWDQIRKSLSSLKHSRVHVTNLGDFVIKHWKLDEKIEMLQKFEENNKLKGVEQIASGRMEICKQCDTYDSEGTGCLAVKTQPCCDQNKGGCGCSLSLKTRSLSSSCPKGKWPAELTQEEEDLINTKLGI